jgi:hypothetical protein
MGLLTDLIARRARERSWVFVLAALILSFYLVLGHDDTLATLWHLYLLLALCVAQLIYPTILAWALLFVSLLAYALSIAVMPGQAPLGEYVLFLALGIVPPAILLLARPRQPRRAVVAALIFASTVVAIVGYFFA